MSSPYIEAVKDIDWLLFPIEKNIARKQLVFSPSDLIVSISVARVPSQSELLLAQKALTCIGVLIPDGGKKFTVNVHALKETEAFRKTVRDVISQVHQRSASSEATLCGSAPVETSDIRDEVLASSIDLRAAVIDLIASSQQSITVASPFWDRLTIEELMPILVRRGDAGVQVSILGRFRQGEHRLYELLRSIPNVRLYAFHQHHHDRIRSFHFKAAVSDQGCRAYLGSANLTTSGLRSTVELGIICEGDLASRIHRVLSAVVRLSTQI